jgi:hypothetical protein
VLLDGHGTDECADVASQMALASARVRRLVRASTSASESWVGLHESFREELSAISGELVSLISGVDDYLRRSDTARGLEELSILRKRKVDRLRNELWKAQEDLRAGLEDVLPHLPRLDGRALPALPAPLDAQELQPRPIREDIQDGIQTAQQAASHGSKRAARAVGGKALKGIDRAGQKLR